MLHEGTSSPSERNVGYLTSGGGFLSADLIISDFADSRQLGHLSRHAAGDEDGTRFSAAENAFVTLTAGIRLK